MTHTPDWPTTNLPLGSDDAEIDQAVPVADWLDQAEVLATQFAETMSKCINGSGHRQSEPRVWHELNILVSDADRVAVKVRNRRELKGAAS